MIDISYEDDEDLFDQTLARARPGEQIIYYRGVTCGGPHRLAAFVAHEARLVYLVQRRVGVGRFEYIAVVKKRIGA